jgi:transcriptional regulator with XRE-family HTH domain
MPDSSKDTDAPTAYAEIGARLRAARGYLGLSQHVVAQHLELPRPAISHIERGTRKVSCVELKKFARLYGRPIAFFLGDESDAGAEPDEIGAAVFRATRELSAADQEQVLQFAEFLLHSRAAPITTERDVIVT